MAITIQYEKYRLSRIVSVQEIESADYVKGFHPASHYHFHEEAWELVVCMDGETEVNRDNHHYKLGVGQIIFIQPGLYHDVSMHDPKAAAFAVSFTCTNSEHLRPLLDAGITADEAQLDLFRKMIDELNATFTNKRDYWHQLHLFNFVPSEDSPLGSEQMICCYLEQVIISLLRNLTMNQGQIVPSGQFRTAIHAYLSDQVTAYIENHLSERLTVDAIAAHFHYSRARLSTIYKFHTGFGINEMITHRRIKRAKVLLLEQTLSITQISEELGFSSPQYFSHKFTEEVGVPPSRYAAFVHSNPETEMVP